VALTRDAMLAPIEVPREEVELPELGGSVWIKGMTASDRSKFEREFQTSSGKRSKRRMDEIRERLVIACVCNEDGTLLLTERDIEAIGRQPIGVIERIVDVAQRLCGMSNADVEAMAKNSDGIDEDN
jgi:hypothetical protein